MGERLLADGSGRVHTAPARWTGQRIDDNRTPSQRLDAEHRREREQARVALDRALRRDVKSTHYVGEFAPLAAMRALGSIDAAELFDRTARERLGEVSRALEWDDPAEIVARIDELARVLRTLIDRKEVA
ncbi:hypothetical protein [Nocardia sp. NPDC058705]|uniref:hypothetical protein n=1 Tax=Nocardia sp. NPDC058705 TaxID=3346609 RepID=UPI00368B2123